AVFARNARPARGRAGCAPTRRFRRAGDRLVALAEVRRRLSVGMAPPRAVAPARPHDHAPAPGPGARHEPLDTGDVLGRRLRGPGRSSRVRGIGKELRGAHGIRGTGPSLNPPSPARAGARFRRRPEAPTATAAPATESREKTIAATASESE